MPDGNGTLIEQHLDEPEPLTKIDPLPDSRTITCYNSNCEDYKVERPYGTPCHCRTSRKGGAKLSTES